MWIERAKSVELVQAVNERPVVFLGGMRQVGKSSLLKRLYPEAMYETLDRILVAEEAQKSSLQFLKKYEGQCIIDEVQYAPELFRALKIIVDEDRAIPAKWILTGSQYLHLMKGVSESLAGRVRILRLHPLSSMELRNCRKFDSNQIDDLQWMGGFPELWEKKGQISPSRYFEDYVQTYIERDLRQIIQVQALGTFRRFFSYLALNVGQLLNYSSLARSLGLSVNTIKSWTQTLEISGIITLLPPFHKNLGKRLVKTPKLYFNDNGLLCSLLSIESALEVNKHPLSGAIYENLILTEFLKKGYEVGKHLFFYRDQNGLEMDFVIEKKGQTHLIEVKRSQVPKVKIKQFEDVANYVGDLKYGECMFKIAAPIDENRSIHLGKYEVFNPLRSDGITD